MSDAYRTSGLPCPHCPGASLRTFANRYICDECQGLLLAFEDFESALHDLTGEHPNPRYDYGDPTKTACPRCERAFVEVTIVLELEAQKIALGERFLRCERDGLWCSGGVLERVFEKVGRQMPRAPSFSSDPAIGPDGLPEVRFATAATGRQRPDRPAAPAIDRYADRSLQCPSCRDQSLAFQDDRWSCTACGGAFVDPDGLVAMVQNISGRYWELPPPGAAGDRGCPVCASALAKVEVEGVVVDGCADHGIWFDAGKLATALEASTKDGRSWFARLIRPRR